MDLTTLNSQTIPAWVIGMLMIYTGWIWIITKDARLRLSSRIKDVTGITWILQGLMYGIWLQVFTPEPNVRAFYSRLAFVLICLAQSLPMTVAYIRSKRNGTNFKRNSSSTSNSH